MNRRGRGGKRAGGERERRESVDRRRVIIIWGLRGVREEDQKKKKEKKKKKEERGGKGGGNIAGLSTGGPGGSHLTESHDADAEAHADGADLPPHERDIFDLAVCEGARERGRRGDGVTG